jgi:hypothetical protein
VKDADAELSKMYDEMAPEQRRRWEGLAELENARLAEAQVRREMEEAEARRKAERALKEEQR